MNNKHEEIIARFDINNVAIDDIDDDVDVMIANMTEEEEGN